MSKTHGAHRTTSRGARTSPRRFLLIVLNTAQVALAGYAAADLARRADADVRGPKAVWAAALGVNWAGPIAYLTFGRRTGRRSGAQNTSTR